MACVQECAEYLFVKDFQASLSFESCEENEDPLVQISTRS
ncbi:uncharacterized protein G2W53_006435 [Senna tora]|uniref:Uncharacterized protein n=1 Tax=Senna tora TaxID=362788 RepID=A0A834X3M8_9FABA|nr:uncharacterized protein G2W53_006435 [Senna tora]